MIANLAPGTVLQFMFVRKRLNKVFQGKSEFVDVGSGNGYLSNLLLKNGYSGYGVDLNSSACENNKNLNREFIKSGKYIIENGDFNNLQKKDFDFLISSMVIEHIGDNDLKIFIKNAKRVIKPQGRLCFLVPSNMSAWGIEDEIAGHVKRYSFKDIDDLALQNGLKVDYKCGLNYPISNWLLTLSNKIVNKEEGYLKTKTKLEQTVYTGNRNVKYKTVFPSYFKIILNELVLSPFYFLQRINANNENSLVMYFELSNL